MSTTRPPTTVVPPPPRTEPPPAAKRPTVRIWLRRVIIAAMLAVLVFGSGILLAIVAYRWIDPPSSTVMLAQRVTGQKIAHTWVPLSRISPNLVRAVIMSEDAGFCRHRGVDWRELEVAIEQARDGIARGGSTISMQVTKNLFLWTAKSYLRKAIEIPVTLVAEAVWPKARTIEIYLNIAEWGPGVFGAEAAAQYHFGKSANRLSEAEAALLAVALPNPIARDSGEPSALQQRLAQNIQARVRSVGDRAGCVLGKG